jgi:perosamine synthetase
MRIPLSSPDITDSEIEAVVRVLRTTQLSMGPKLEEFERRFAEFSCTRCAVAISSGTSGLHACVRALGLGPGDEVITTPFSFIASANALLYEGVVPVFVDIDPHTLNIDPAKIEAAITPRTRALLIVHVFGRPSPMHQIISIARRHGLNVIEDACEAIGAEIEGERVGGIGDIGVFGFYPNKQITTGEGGMVVTNDTSLSSSVKICRNQGRDSTSDWFDHTDLGYNYRLSEMNCALGIAQLERIENILLMRESVARRYTEKLKGNSHLILPELVLTGGRISWFTYVVRLSEQFTRADRDRIVAGLKKEGIGCGRYFAPIHLQPLYVRLFGYSDGDFPFTEDNAARSIALPFFNRITDDQIDEVTGRLCELTGSR